MDEVLKLVNRLQSACTLLGDTAGQSDKDLPGLWEMLPSIVVIGGQVGKSMCADLLKLGLSSVMASAMLVFLRCRVLVRVLSWRLLWE